MLAYVMYYLYNIKQGSLLHMLGIRMSSDVSVFFKPNEFIAVIDQLPISRTGKHLCNYFFKLAQEEIKLHNHQGSWFEFNINDVNELAQIRNKNYKHIDHAITGLMHPVKVRAKDDTKHIFKTVLLPNVMIDLEKGIYRFQLNDIVMALLTNTDYYTKLNLQEMNPLASKYSIVILEWLKRYESSPKIPIIGIDELRQITGTQDAKSYDDFSLFKSRVIDVAKNEINETTPYQVSYEPIKTRAKTRHKVTAIQFYFSKKEIKKEIKTEAKKKTENAAPISSAYEKLRKVCGRYMTLKFYYNATYIYHIETLEQFADDCAEKNYHPNKTKFFEWLDERCSINQKGYYKQYHIYSEKFFKSVFSTEEIDPSSVVTTEDGREMWLGRKIQHVHEEYVSEAMKFYGELPYNEYKHYLSGIWQRFEQQFNVNRDNVFRTMGE